MNPWETLAVLTVIAAVLAGLAFLVVLAVLKFGAERDLEDLSELPPEVTAAEEWYRQVIDRAVSMSVEAQTNLNRRFPGVAP